MAVAVINYAEQQMDADSKWVKMSPDERKRYSERVRKTTIELMVARATRLGLDSQTIAARAGYTSAWMTNVNKGKTSRIDALVEVATSIGYPLSFFMAMAEDLIEIEDERERALNAKDGGASA